MFFGKRKYEVSDPAYYDPLIAKQKSHARQNPNDPVVWLELGRLHEAKIDMTNYFAERYFVYRCFIPIYALLFPGGLLVSILSIFMLPLHLWQGIGLMTLMITFIIVLAIYVFFLRYPPSGKKYFKKAIALDPHCGETCMYLGLIALRRYQKRKACRYLEQAVRLNANNKNKIEQKLKSIYEKEFMSFFTEKSDKEIRFRKIIDHQLDQIKQLRSKNVNLEKRVESLSAKADQAKWETSHKAKKMDKEMQQQVSTIRQDYENQIALLKQEARAETKELAERDFIRLTTEIMESKAGLEVQSFDAAGKTVENKVGKSSWQALSEQTRLYLATAEQVYAVLTEQKEKSDYSLVGMELCKALETEINRKLVEPFAEHLNGDESEFLRIHQTGEHKDRPLYFTYLAKVVDQTNYPEVTSLTLGQYHFVLNLTLKKDYALKEYGDFLDWICADSGTIIEKTFLKKLEIVTKRYRNTIAHNSPMNKRQYDHLRELIFAGNEALLKACCRIVMGINNPS